MQTIHHMNTYFKPLDEIITKKFLPALMGSIVSDDERDLYSLPVKDGSLEIPILQECVSVQYESLDVHYLRSCSMCITGSRSL